MVALLLVYVLFISRGFAAALAVRDAFGKGKRFPAPERVAVAAGLRTGQVADKLPRAPSDQAPRIDQT